MEADFDTWYAEARPRVLATMVLVVGDTHHAAECVDEAFVRTVERWSSVQYADSPLAWTVRVAINVSRRTARRASIERRVLHRSGPRPDVPAAAGEAWHAVATLPPRQREVTVLRYVADLPEAEIAQILGISRSSVSDSLTDARRRLAVLLSDPEVRHA